MDGTKRDCTWPVLCILACLFVLAAAAPRTWQQVSRHHSAQDLMQQFAAASDAATAEELRVRQRLESATRLSPIPPAVSDSHTEEPVILPKFHVVAEPAAKVTGLVSDLLGETGREAGVLSLPAASLTYDGPILDDLAISSPDASVRSAGPVLVAARVAGEGVNRVAVLRPEKLLPALEERPSAPEPAQPAIKPVWQLPVSLARRLELLCDECETGSWAIEASRTWRRLGRALTENSPTANARFQELEELGEESKTLADSLEDEGLATALRRAGYALARRAELCKQVVLAGGAELKTPPLPKTDPKQLAYCLAKIEELHPDPESAKSWSDYLLVDALQQLTVPQEVKPDVRSARRLAQRVLHRLNRTSMSAEQREFVARQPLRDLDAVLQTWAAEPVDLARLLESVEKFEQTGLPSDARRVAHDYHQLTLARQPEARELSQRLDEDYRNANLRLVISAELLNRLVPARAPEYAYVQDTILGIPVHGRSLAMSDVRICLVPDPGRLRLAFQVAGQVTSATSSSSGPATFFNDSVAHYVAEKGIEIDDSGIHLEEAAVQASSNTRLRSLRTAFDGIPLVGMLVQSVARSQHEQYRPDATREADWKISTRARQRIDAEARAQVSAAVQRLRERVYEPLDGLQLRPTIISGQTTEERMTMRLRLAAEHQLAGCTPRPRAPDDSLASVQIHETAVNNLLEQLELDGQTMTIAELAKHVAEKLQSKQPWTCDPAHADVTITFADRDALSIRCQGGRVVLRLGVARLSSGTRVWNSFQAQVFYRPQINGRNAELVRDGVIYLIGRMSTGNQIAVRGILAKAFPQNTPCRIVPARLIEDESLSDLAISQFVIEDGWIGAALGSQGDQIAQRPE